MASTCRGKKIVPFRAGLGISFSQTSLVVSVGNVPPLGTKRYPLPLLAFKNFLVSTQNDMSVVSIFGIFRGSLGYFYIVTGFSRHFKCIIQI